MGERYTKLFGLEGNLYAENSPVLVCAGALTKDNQTGKLFCQVRMENLDARAIRILKLEVTCRDAVGRVLGTPTVFQYPDLDVAGHSQFGGKTPIAIPDRMTRSFSVCVREVAFADGTVVELAPTDWRALPAQTELCTLLPEPADVKHFRRLYCDRASFVSDVVMGIRRCTCGATYFESEDVCYRCGCACRELDGITPQIVRDRYTISLAREQAAGGRAAGIAKALALYDSLEGREMGETLAEELARQVYETVAPLVDSELMADMNRAEGPLAVLAARDYRDSASLHATCLKQKSYLKAIECAGTRSLESISQAIELFASLDDWKDSATRLAELRENIYAAADAKTGEKKASVEALTRVRDQFLVLGEWKDAAQRARETDARVKKMGKRRTTGRILIGVSAVLLCALLFLVLIPVISVMNGGYSYAATLYAWREIELPADATEVSDEAFKGLKDLKSVKIPEGVTRIGRSAFEGCTGLTSITIPESVTSIEDGAFRGCTGLTSITIPESVTSIGSNAFYGCDSLASVYVTDIAKWCAIEFGSSSANPLACAGSLYLNGALVTHLEIPASVTSIGNYAFDGCTGVSSIVIPEGVTSIGSHAFDGCTGVSSIVIPESVTSIGEGAFEGTRITSATLPTTAIASIPKDNLQTVVINGGVWIEKGAFSRCSSLTSITIPFVGAMRDGMRNTHFGYIFGASSSSYNSTYVPKTLKTVVITGGTSIGERAFYNCNSLESITIPEGVTSIGEYAFDGCTGVSSIVIPEGVTSIGKGVFHGCSSLTSVTIPAGVTSIEDGAFRGCTGLSSVAIPDSVASIGNYAFDNCSALTSITIPAGVTSIENGTFRGCTGLSSVAIPDSVASIGEEAFYNCTGLTNVTFGENSQLLSIGEDAFYNCSSLTSITIPTGVTSIGEDAFSCCYRLVEVYKLSPHIAITKGNSNNGYVGYYALDVYTSADTPSKLWTDADGYQFYEDGDVRYLVSYVGSDTELTLPEDCHRKSYGLRRFAFYNCDSLTNVTVPSSVTSIGGWTFYGCGSLKSITLPFVGAAKDGRSNTHFGYIFGASDHYDNDDVVPSSLKTVVITGGTSIGERAFYNCNSLESITIPASVTSIGNYAFRGCSSLTSITIPFVGAAKDGTSNTHFGYIFGASSYSYNSTYVPSSLKAVVITGGTFIGSYAFYNCSSLESITIPAGVTSIGGGAFSRCSSLTSITIPFVGATKDGSEDTHFGYIFGASSYSYNSTYVPSSLKTVVITGGTSIGNYAFSDCNALRSITIPASVTSIGNYAFDGCTLANVYYGGTMEDWSKISIGEYNSALTSANIYDCTENKPSDDPSGGTDDAPSDAPTEDPTEESTEAPTEEATAEPSEEPTEELTEEPSEESTEEPTEEPSEESTEEPTEEPSFSQGLEYRLLGDGTYGVVGVGTCADTAIVIPETYEGKPVTSIGNSAFEDCTSLTSVVIPEGVTSIGKSSFKHCNSLRSITLPFVGATEDGISNTHFGYIFGASSYYYSNTYIPGSLKTVVITGGESIGSHAFDGCTWVSSIVIPEGVTSIGEYAFSSCDSLTSIVIPEGVTSIGEYAFYGCDSLASVYVTDIAKWCAIEFGSSSANPLGCAGSLYLNGALVTHLEIPASVTSIGNYAFAGCTGLSSIVIPESVTSIGSDAFDGCRSLTGVYVTDIAKWCAIEFGSSYANPLGCAGSLYLNGALVTHLEIPASVTSIGNYAFAGCTGLSSIVIPEGVTRIGKGAFHGCDSLTSITLPFVGAAKDGASNTHFGYIFGASDHYDNDDVVPSSLETVVVTGGTSIGEDAFYYCDSLTSITIPEGVTSIGEYAFSSCDSLTSIVIPASVTSIGEYAFYGCDSLASVYYGGTAEDWSNIDVDSYNSSLTSATIYYSYGKE